MPVPTYDKFIEPILRFLAAHPDGALARDTHEAAAQSLGISDIDRQELLPSGANLFTRTEQVGLMIGLSAQAYRAVLGVAFGNLPREVSNLRARILSRCH